MTLCTITCSLIATAIFGFFVHVQYFLYQGDLFVNLWDPTGTIETTNLHWLSLDLNPNETRGTGPMKFSVITNYPSTDAFISQNEQPTVLFLHGFPETALVSWHNQFQYFINKGYRIIAPDQRGYNTSFKSSDMFGYALDDLLNDTIVLLDQLQVEKVHLVGHDWGAAVAWGLADKYPDRFIDVVVINVPHPKAMEVYLQSHLSQLSRSWYIFYFQIPYLPEDKCSRNNFEFLQNVVQGARNGPKKYSTTERELLLEAWSQDGVVSAMLNWYRASVQLQHPGFRRKIKSPILILWGENDVALEKEMVEPSLALCENGRAEMFPGMSHFLQHDDPEGVSTKIERFWERGA